MMPSSVIYLRMLKKPDIACMEISDSVLEYKNRDAGYRNVPFGEVMKLGYPIKYVVVSVNGEDAALFETKNRASDKRDTPW